MSTASIDPKKQLIIKAMAAIQDAQRRLGAANSREVDDNA